MHKKLWLEKDRCKTTFKESETLNSQYYKRWETIFTYTSCKNKQGLSNFLIIRASRFEIVLYFYFFYIYSLYSFNILLIVVSILIISFLKTYSWPY